MAHLYINVENLVFETLKQVAFNNFPKIQVQPLYSWSS